MQPPWWVVWIFGLIVLVPLVYFIGSGGVPSMPDASPAESGTWSAVSIAAGWTCLSWVVIRREWKDD